MRILICGDRHWTNYYVILHAVMDILREKHIDDPSKVYIIEGEAQGADLIGKQVAHAIGVPNDHILEFPAPWNDVDGKPSNQLGKRNNGSPYWKLAGPFRNQQMIEFGQPNLVLAFHNSIANSKGTKNMLLLARKAGIESYIITEDATRVGQTKLFEE